MSWQITPANEKQKQLMAALESRDVDIVGAFGPSGTGKSYVTCNYALKALSEGRYSRFVIVRPLVDVSTGRRYSSIELGPHFFSVASSYLYDLVGPQGEEHLRKLLDEGRVVLADPSFLIGRTFDRTLLFLDDAQHLPPETIREAMLRLGGESKLVVAGDPVVQAPRENSAALARELLLGEERTFVVDFGIRDIVRPGAKRALKFALEARVRAREMSEEERKLMSLAYAHAPDAQLVTVVDLRPLKEKHSITSKNTPDALLISKEGYLGRLIGKGGERIQKMEKESGMALRGVELTLDLKQLVASMHPVGWIRRHLRDADIVGTNLEVEVDSENFGAFVGQKGAFIRFLDEAMRSLLGVGLRARSVEAERKEEERGRRKAAKK